MGLKKGKGKHGIADLQKRLADLGEMPAVLDVELQGLARDMMETAINMAPIHTERLRKSIKYRRTGGERNAKGQFFKGGIGMHIVELQHKAPYFQIVHDTMQVGRNGGKFQPSEKSVETAAAAGEIAGGLFMERSRQKYAPIILATLSKKAQQFIRMTF